MTPEEAKEGTKVETCEFCGAPVNYKALIEIETQLGKEAEDGWEAWSKVAHRVGEELSDNGPAAYYDFSASDWREWALKRIQGLKARSELAERMAEALREGIKVAKMTLSDCGPCEHDVNICVCGLIADIGMMEEALTAWDAIKGDGDNG